MRLGVVDVIAALTLFGCGSAPATTPTAVSNCSDFSWAFSSTGSDSLRLPLAGKVLTITSLQLHGAGQAPTDQGVCDDHATNVTWESSNPAVASITPFSARGATVVALSPGTTTITARFVVDGAPMSISLTITVLPALTPSNSEM
jgi:hypothetical protein